tara:strand:+ start:23785 stop:24609 length:825 start_codon:yes stop_codon:yes gene_type:complete
MTKLLIAILFICTLAQGLAQKIYYRPYSKAYNESVGGIKDVQLMVSKEFQYPIKTVQQELDGEVRLSFQLNRKGAVTDLKVVSSTTPEMAKEATRLFKKIQWTKSEYRPIHMTFRDEFIVEFNLKKWVKLYNKRGYQYIDYPVTPIDTSEKIYFIKAVKTKPIPVFKDGEYNSFNHYISRKMRYPETAQKLNLKGTVLIAFVIEPSGQISNIEVRKAMNGGCTQEAIRLVKDVTWIPGQQEGTAVRTQMITSIGFGMSSDAFYETFNQGNQGAN